MKWVFITDVAGVDRLVKLEAICELYEDKSWYGDKKVTYVSFGREGFYTEEPILEIYKLLNPSEY